MRQPAIHNRSEALLSFGRLSGGSNQPIRGHPSLEPLHWPLAEAAENGEDLMVFEHAPLFSLSLPAALEACWGCERTS